MTKYYRVIKTMPSFDVGAILRGTSSTSGYRAINDIWDRFDGASDCALLNLNIELEANSEFFLRVYPIGNPDDLVFGTKAQAQQAANALYKGVSDENE